MSDLAQRLRDSTQFYHSDCELKMGCAARIEELEEQRDELLEALEQIANMGVPVQKTEHRIARAAIAKAKGE